MSHKDCHSWWTVLLVSKSVGCYSGQVNLETNLWKHLRKKFQLSGLCSPTCNSKSRGFLGKTVLCQVLKGAGSQSGVSVCQHTLRGSVAARLFTGEQWSWAQLCVFVLGSGTFTLVYLGVLKRVFGYEWGIRTRHQRMDDRVSLMQRCWIFSSHAAKRQKSKLGVNFIRKTPKTRAQDVAGINRWNLDWKDKVSLDQFARTPVLTQCFSSEVHVLKMLPDQ